MNYKPIIQLSEEWWELKAGKIGGTMFGMVISGRKNSLIYQLVSETISGEIERDDYESLDIQFGRENESVGMDLLEAETGIKFLRGGLIFSDESEISIASPDGINLELGIVAEGKCTRDRTKHTQRFFEGPETAYMPQIKNYFVQSDDVKEVWWWSYCPFVTIKPLIIKKFKREDFEKDIIEGRKLIKNIESDLKAKVKQFTF